MQAYDDMYISKMHGFFTRPSKTVVQGNLMIEHDTQVLKSGDSRRPEIEAQSMS